MAQDRVDLFDSYLYLGFSGRAGHSGVGAVWGNARLRKALDCATPERAEAAYHENRNQMLISV